MQITPANAAIAIEVLEIDLASLTVKITAAQRSFHSKATAALVAEKREIQAKIAEARAILAG